SVCSYHSLLDVRICFFCIRRWMWLNFGTIITEPVSESSCSCRTTTLNIHSRVAAVLAPCLVCLAIAAMLGLALVAAKLRERRQTEGGFRPRQLQASGGRNPPPPPMERLI
uniref:Uncharacterized protein n=1 Tax=Poecilia mexicana TaxID=48701 RepID=A0A3B3XMU2_9TELE